MEKENDITTAANSKTMNAIENIKLFAAAEDMEPAIDFTDGDKDLKETTLCGYKTNRGKLSMQKKD